MLPFKQSVAHPFHSIWNEMLQVLWDTHKKSWICQINKTNLLELKIKSKGNSNNNWKQETVCCRRIFGNNYHLGHFNFCRNFGVSKHVCDFDLFSQWHRRNLWIYKKKKTVQKPNKPTFFQTARMKEQANENVHVCQVDKEKSAE